MTSFAALGNDLYTGRRSVDFVGRYKRWYIISGVLLGLAVLGLVWHGLNLSLEFRGGSEFRVTGVSASTGYEVKAKDAVRGVAPGSDVSVTHIGSNQVRVQTDKLDDSQSVAVKNALAKTYDKNPQEVSASFVGPSWGASVSQKALQALIVFLLLVALVMALYFRTWKMSVASLVALLHDLVITVGIYALAGFEVSPASMIGFLTILGYSLYDTVVVFDKVRENTTEAMGNGRMTYAQAANLAVNQTLVRSINTTVVALLPIGSLLVIGILFLGPGTLLDLSLALFVGIAAGAYSSIFIATPLFVHMREKEPVVVDLARRAQRHQAKQAAAAQAQPVTEGELVEEGDAAAGAEARERVSAAAAPGRTAGAAPTRSGEGEQGSGRRIHPYAQTGPRNQPKRPPRSRR